MYTSNTKNNFLCPHDVFEDIKFQELSLSVKFLYVFLCKLANRFANSDGWFYRSIPQLTKDTQMNRNTVIKAKKILKKYGFIDIKRGYFKHSKKRTYDYFRLNGFRVII